LFCMAFAGHRPSHRPALVGYESSCRRLQVPLLSTVPRVTQLHASTLEKYCRARCAQLGTSEIPHRGRGTTIRSVPETAPTAPSAIGPPTLVKSRPMTSSQDLCKMVCLLNTKLPSRTLRTLIRDFGGRASGSEVAIDFDKDGSMPSRQSLQHRSIPAHRHHKVHR